MTEHGHGPNQERDLFDQWVTAMVGPCPQGTRQEQIALQEQIADLERDMALHERWEMQFGAALAAWKERQTRGGAEFHRNDFESWFRSHFSGGPLARPVSALHAEIAALKQRATQIEAWHAKHQAALAAWAEADYRAKRT